jgi:hypothetical protein
VFNGNKVNVLKTIKLILIRAHLHISNIYTSREKKSKLKRKTIMLGTYENKAQFDYSKVPN